MLLICEWFQISCTRQESVETCGGFRFVMGVAPDHPVVMDHHIL